MIRCGSLRYAALSAALTFIPLAVEAHDTSMATRPVAASSSVTTTVQQRHFPGVLRAPRPVSAAQQQKGPTKNAIYGAIAQITGNVLTIRTRTGGLRRVDATPAFNAGTVSAPLFVGKLVVAEGLTRTDGVLTAARISRLARLERTGSDR